MKKLIACTVLLTLSAVPAFGQTADSSGQTAASTGSVDLSGFRDEIANRNKALADKVRAEQMLVKKNAAIIEDAKKIDADNKRLDAERKQLDAQNAEFERQRQAMMSVLGESSASSDASPSAPAPARVDPQPQPTRVESQPARVEQQPRMELAGASVIPAGSNMNQNPAQVSDPIVRTPPAGQANQQQPVQYSQPTQYAQPSQPVQVAAAMPVAASATVVASSSSGPMRVPENVAMGLLLSPIRPVYPQIAQNARIQGEVVLEAVISKTGLIETLSPVSGPELLRRAAIDAVQKAHYQPYKVNGENVEVMTTVTVVFRMQS